MFLYQVTITGTNSAKGVNNNLVAVGTGSSSRDTFEEDFRMYPNPARNVLNIQLAEGNEFTYAVRNMLGQVVLKGTSEREINVSGLTRVY